MADVVVIDITEAVEAVVINITAPGGASNMRFGTTAPSGSLGAINDCYLNTVTGWFYQKTAISTWTRRGVFAVNIANTHADFVCPDGETRQATLSNIPL